MVNIGSPLFILREECNKDLMQVLGRIAELGFDGVEFLGLFGHKAPVIRKKLDEYGLRAIGDHVPFDEFSLETDRVIDEHKTMGCGFITIAPPGASGLPGGVDYPATIETILRLGEAVNEAGMKLLFHNHADELKQKVNNKTLLMHLMDDTPADVLYLEPDLGWMRIGGANPYEYLEKYKNRCPVVHFKDYMPFDSEAGFIFRPTGYGAMDNAALYMATLDLAPRPEWYVMDHDCAYERDIYDDLKISLEYFKNLVRI
jgi:sugar phosphate isomerase/epimerase